jgi:hypothetical protein
MLHHHFRRFPRCQEFLHMNVVAFYRRRSRLGFQVGQTLPVVQSPSECHIVTLMDGYPQLDGGQYPPETYMAGAFGGGAEYPGVAPFEEFSTEDNQLLMSVLSGTPAAEQYNIAYPQSAQSSFQMWDGQSYNPYQGAHYGFPSGGLSPHMSHAFAGSRSPHMSHPSHPNTMQQSMASPSSQMHQQTSPPFATAQPHNPFAVHRDSPSHGAVKPETVVPVFTPTTPPYAVHAVPNNFGAALPLPNSAHSTRT